MKLKESVLVVGLLGYSSKTKEGHGLFRAKLVIFKPEYLESNHLAAIPHFKAGEKQTRSV